MKAVKTLKVRNWIIEYTSPISGWLTYDGKVIPRWGCGMRFHTDEFGFRCDYPEVVPEYVRQKLLTEYAKMTKSRK